MSQPQQNPVFAPYEYWRDALERSILFMDILRERGNIYDEQIRRVAPNVLNFDAELVCDGRTLDTPVNYALVRIKPPEDVTIDPAKRPFIVFDPRAGHGPGIGGMKHDSEIGVALKAGHACYFVGFLPDPMPGQTIEDVCRAEAHFVTLVVDMHKEADGKPVLIGNCQAGWQIMIMAALKPELPGPIILAGAPLSYWAGVRGKNPMRYLGGLLGGSWLTTFAGDVGNGEFDGASLVANFESNNPANTWWTKPYNVYSKVDTEGPRFLEFEKWWGNPVVLGADEMQFIVDELFVGNKLTAGKIRTKDGQRVDLRKIRSPIVVFCSFGDNITPPQQALDWVLDLYDSVDDIVANGQTIIYTLHQSIGHLGIFVSGGVATKQHQEFTLNMNMIDTMPPGLYEFVLSGRDKDTANPDLVSGDYVARIEPRTLDDIRALGGNDEIDERKFETVSRVSEITQGLYATFASPVVKAMISPASAKFIREIHPNRIRFGAFSDHNPLMAPVKGLAEKVRADRHPVSANNPLLAGEKLMSDWIENNWKMFADARDAMSEAIFHAAYGSLALQAAVGLKGAHASDDRRIERDLSHAETHAVNEENFEHGGLLEASLRALMYVLRGDTIDERQFNKMTVLRDHAPQNERISLSEFKSIIRRESALLRADAVRAMAAIPAMLPDDPSRRGKVAETIVDIVMAGDPDDEVRGRLEEVRRMFAPEETTTKKARRA
ncbi:MAG: DUF3141 domain-containing protein [Rhodoblastus sp.]